MPTLPWKSHVCSTTSTQPIITICIHQALMTWAPTNPTSAKELLAFVFILIYHSAVSNHIKLKLGLQVVSSNANLLCLLHVCVCVWYVYFLNCKTAMEISQSGYEISFLDLTIKIGHIKVTDICLHPKQEPTRWCKQARSRSSSLYASLTGKPRIVDQIVCLSGHPMQSDDNHVIFLISLTRW